MLIEGASKFQMIIKPIDLLSSVEKSLDNENFGKIAYMVATKGQIESDKKRKLETFVETSNKRPRNEPLNTTNSFHNGRACSKCNNLASFFNDKNIKITLPKQHPYGRCPLYCNLCDNKIKCSEPEKHLIYSCKICDTTYSNHPTDKCKVDF